MKKRILSFVLAFLAFLASAATTLKLPNSISLNFEGCTDGSIRIEALSPAGKAPAKEFELKRTPSKDQFTKNTDGIYNWNEYSLQPTEAGYKLFYKNNLMYESSFKEEKKLLREIRKWEQASEFYGFGEASRYANLSNQSFTIYNVSRYGDHAYVFIPFYVTNTNTAVYYNANGKDWIYFQHEKDEQSYTSEFKRIECFVRQDSSRMESVEKFYKETETSCLMPKWAFGYIQSKYGYKSADEVIQLVDDFKSRNIPLSAVVLDLYWFQKMGDISWTSKNFADWEKMNQHMEENNVKLITITEPFFSTASVNYNELKSSNLLCKDEKGKIKTWRDWWCVDNDKEGALFNPLGKKASKFMGAKYSDMLNKGIDGFWTDLGEPEGAKPEVMYNKYKEVEFHNYYNVYWSKALYEGVHKINPDQRLFIMSRSAGTGSGKYSVSVWSGDVSVSWPSLSQQISYGINAGLSGLAYWGSDVGGFTPENSPEELYIRWQQFGAFTPIYRAHGTGPREPYYYSEKAEKIVSDVIRTRMALVPYIYSTARQTMNGTPMMRPMFYEDEKTPVEFMGTQYMFGDAFLVSPVVKSPDMETEHTTYLPAGTWYDFYTNEKVVSSGNTITTKNTPEKIPVYVKEGSIIPQEKDGHSYLYIYPSENKTTSFTWYNDDGVTEQYKNGNYTEILFQLEGNKLKAEIKGNETYLPEEFLIQIPNSKAMPKNYSISELKDGIEF